MGYTIQQWIGVALWAIGFVACSAGAIRGLLAWRRRSRPAAWRAAALFGFGLVLTWLGYLSL